MRRLGLLTILIASLSGCAKAPNQTAPSLANLNFVPLAKGITVFDGSGDLENGRLDQFAVQKSYENARRDMRNGGWIEISSDSFVTHFKRQKPPPGYHDVRVTVMRAIDERQSGNLSKDWGNVMVFRSTKPPKADPRLAEIRQSGKTFNELSDKLRTAGELTQEEIRTLERLVDTTEPVSVMRGMILLVIAEEKGLYSKERVRPIVEKNAYKTNSESIQSFVRVYLDTSKWARKTPDDKVYELIKLVRAKPRDETIYDEMERNAIEFILSRPASHDRARVCELLLAKSRLKEEERAWASARIGRAVQRETGEAREFWLFARRVLDARNPSK